MNRYYALFTLIALPFFCTTRPGFIKEIFGVMGALDEMNQRNRQAIRDYFTPTPTTDDEKTASPPSNKPRDLFFELAGELPEEVIEIAEFIKNEQQFTALGASMPCGILLVGPPGTGKTSIARAIAHHSDAHFISTSASSFINTYVGTGPNAVKRLFEEAREHTGKVIIFIDELDAMGDRDDLHNAEYKNTITELLHQMDGLNRNNDIFVIAATNKADAIDPALIRPGRFDRIVEIELPDLENRSAILQHYVNKLPSVDALDLPFLAEVTDGFSGAELEALVNEAAINAVRTRSQRVGLEHFETAFKRAVKMRRHR